MLSIVVLSLLVSGCLWRYGVNGKYFTQPGGATTVDTTALRLDGYYWSYRPAPSGGTHGTSPLILWRDGSAALSDIVFGLDIQAEHDDVIGMLKGKTGERRSPIYLTMGRLSCPRRLDLDSGFRTEWAGAVVGPF